MKLYLNRLGKLLSISLALLLLIIPPMPAHAALYWNAGVRARDVSICFVGDALSSRPTRVQQILDYIKEIEYAANVKFNYLGTCPASQTQANGKDFFDGDIRVAIPYTAYLGNQKFAEGSVPGQGCQMFIKDGNYNGNNDGWGSWSNSPSDLSVNRACLYNLKLGDDPWPPAGGTAGDPPSSVPYLDHTLHEFGHALGLAHEHVRNDVDKTNCQADGYGGSASNGLITPYDKLSVMHYKFSTCGINGNYDNKGLSAWDRLAVHILYPEDAKTAEFVGTTVARVSTPITLSSAWKQRGANLDYVAKNFSWKLSGNTVSTSAQMNTTISTPQEITLEFKHDDFLGRKYSYVGKIYVLDDKTYSQQIAAPVAAQLPLL